MTIWFIALLRILWKGLTGVSWLQIRRNVGEGFVYIGNKIAGRYPYMEPMIDLVFKDGENEEFSFKVSLTVRRYDITIGVYDTYEEAGQVCDNIEKTIKELQ